MIQVDPEIKTLLEDAKTLARFLKSEIATSLAHEHLKLNTSRMLILLEEKAIELDERIVDIQMKIS